MEHRTVRVGIDVGGTHTKAVAIDNATHEIIGKSSVKTTHSDRLGVARGVVQAFQNCLFENNIKPEEVVFIAHSTTQATNALLEGDVAKVGILGMSKGGLEALFGKRQTRIEDIPLDGGSSVGTGKYIRTSHVFQKTNGLNAQIVRENLKKLTDGGAQVIVASKAFGVDNFTEEELVQEEATKMGLPCTVASDITKMYGLTTRTRTAIINASILPKMLDTANSTQQSVLQTGIQVPLMMMRGDGGVMEVEEMKKRPVLTMLSGPAASVVGALMYLRASNGIYFEVGGTSTNIGVIKNGRPTVNYSIIGGHRTYISSLDVRVLGVAGGSLVRAADHRLEDVGPRSAHIAGLEYAAFTPEEEIVEPVLEFFRPKPDDPEDYVCIRLKSGKRIALTNTCAANVLKLIKPEYFACGSYNSCVKAMQPLAEYLGVSVEEAARQILAKSCEKIVEVINDLSEEYRLETDQSVLVGCGGGAAALIPFAAQLLGLKYDIPENAEVISSIGVALAMVRDVVERVIPNPSMQDIAEIKQEAKMMAINSGAVPDSVEVHIEIDSQTQKVTAIAMGSTEVQTTDLLRECTVEEAKAIAADSLSIAADQMVFAAGNDQLYVFTNRDGENNRLRVVDKKGFIKVQRRDADVEAATVENCSEVIKHVWNSCCNYRTDTLLVPDMFVLLGSRVLDFAGVQNLEQVNNILATELVGLREDEPLIVIGGRNRF